MQSVLVFSSVLLAIAWWTSSTYAAPIPAALPTPTTATFLSDLPISRSLSGTISSLSNTSCNDIRECRTIWNIIWSCLATIIACTWVAIHPNVPAEEDSWWTVNIRRLKIMVYAIIAPEMIMVWALRQAIGAYTICRKHKEKYGWTKMHGFFVQMGGFLLYEGDSPSHALSLKELEDLAANGVIDFPRITKKEIEDRSKRDLLSKGLAVGQTTWFALQCLSRAIQGLAITELELVTLGFAVLNAVTYGLWWHKPIDVQSAYPVYAKKSQRSSRAYTESERPRSDDRSIASATTEVEQSVEVDNANYEKSEREPDQERQRRRERGREASRRDSRGWKQSQFIRRLKGKFRRIQEDIKMDGIVWFLWDTFIGHPIDAMILPFIHMFSCDEESILETKVPTFNAARPASLSQHASLYIVSAVLAIIFGGIHCIAWNFEFPSDHQRMIWRISALAALCLPVYLGVTLGVRTFIRTKTTIGKKKEMYGFRNFCVMLFFIAPVFAYFAARLALLVQACMLLADLPEGAFKAVQWSMYIPHFG